MGVSPTLNCLDQEGIESTFLSGIDNFVPLPDDRYHLVFDARTSPRRGSANPSSLSQSVATAIPHPWEQRDLGLGRENEKRASRPSEPQPCPGAAA